MNRLLPGFALFFCVCFLSCNTQAAYEFDTVGVRHGKTISKFSGMTQQAVTVTFRRNNPPPKFFYPASLDFAVGQFSRDNDDSLFISFGPSFRPEIGWFRDTLWFFEYGIHPTLLKGSQFGDKNIGGDVQFTTHIGFGGYFGRRRKGSFLLRIQHTSNGRVNDENPGVDMITLEFNYGFKPVRNRWRDAEN